MGLARVTLTCQVTSSVRSCSGSVRTNEVWSLAVATTVCAPALSVPATKVSEGEVPAGWPSTVQLTESACVSGAGPLTLKFCDCPDVSWTVEAFDGANESTGETVL